MTATPVQPGSPAAAVRVRRPRPHDTGQGAPVRLALIALTVAAGLTVVLPAAAPARPALVFVAALLVPGAALLGALPRPVLRDPTWPTWLAVSFALSAALLVAGATVMAVTHVWHPEAWLAVLAVASVLTLCFPRTETVPPVALTAPTPRTLAVLGLLAVGVLLWALSLGDIPTTGLSDYGLPPDLPIAWYAGVACALAGALAAVLRGRSDGPAAVAVAVLAIMLFGTIPALGGPPWYTWVYKHIGVVEYIETHAGTALGGDIYQRWPGFFSASAAVAVTSGRAAPAAFAGWAEPVFALVQAFLVAAVAHALRLGRSAAWAAALLFVVADWVGQTYFSPQALSFTLLLAFFALLLQVTAPTPYRPWLDRALVRLRRRRPGRHQHRSATGAPLRIAPPPITIVLLVLLQACITVSHQLSPYLLAVGLALLAVVTPVRPRWLLPVIAAVPVAYLIPHLRFVQANFGIFTGLDIFSNVQRDQPYASVTAGKAFNSLTSQTLSVTVWVVAVLALVIGLRARPAVHRILGALFVSPFFLVVGQDYGGEASLRVFLFTLPWAALAIAATVRAGARPRWRACWAALCVALAALFVPAFFGQAELNLLPRDEVQAAAEIYRIGRDGGVLMLAGPNFPRAYSGRYDEFTPSAAASGPNLLMAPSPFSNRPLGSPQDVDLVVESMQAYANHGLLVFSTSEDVYTQVFGLTPPGQLDALEGAVARDPRFRLVLVSPNVRVYALGDAVREGIPTPMRLPSRK